jgi:two-component system, chemotaxis family, chemotaxis protein CheY
VDRTPVDCKTVLVVDDDRDIRDVLTDALEAEGYRVITAADGQEALDWLRQRVARPCVILLDLMMPRLDGIQFRTEVLNDPELAVLPVVVLSADPSIISGAKSLNFSGSLRKPVALEALLAAVHAHCA